MQEKPDIPPQFFEYFVRDAGIILTRLEEMLEKISKNSSCEDEDFKKYAVSTHSLKTALALIGEQKLSSLAAYLEKAGSQKELSIILAETPSFLDKLRTIIINFTPHNNENYENKISEENYAYLLEKILAVRKSCDTFDIKTAKDIVNTLRQVAWPSPIRELLNDLAENLLSGDFLAVLSTISKIKEII